MTEQHAVKGGDQHPPDSSVKLNGPPGTGKTTQLLERVTRLLDQGYSLNDITFVTYRTEMAEEFLRRLHARGYVSEEEVEEPWQHDTRHFGTLHAVCNRITTNAETVEDHHRREFLWDEYMVRYDGRGSDDAGAIDNNDAVGSELFDAYSWCIQNENHSFVNAPNYKEIQDEWPQRPSFEEFDTAWTEYKEDGGEDGDLLQDFDDMLRTVAEDELRAPGEVLIVDEYHDFTPIMSSIAEQWMDGKDIVIVGGDPLQAIYSYKGASPQFFTNLDLPEVVLDRTYRVPSNVWDYAQSVIDHDTPDIQPDAQGGKVTAARGDPADVVSKYGSDGSVMFLARTQGQIYDISQRLKQEGILFRSQQGIGGWNQAARRMNLYNALQKLNGVEPALKVNPNTGQSGLGRYDGDDVQKGVKSPHMVTFTSEEAAALTRFTPADYFADTKTSFSTTVSAKAKIEGEELLDVVEPSFWDDMTNGPETVDNLLSYDSKPTIKRALQANDGPVESLATADVPDVLTIHAAKGREADTVALYDGVPPAVQDAMYRDERNQRAESRVWYVAVTRAAENLLVFRDEHDYCSPYLPSIT
jgi:DNA helicase-2/ATP-dependent DNA helicase PcrA